MPSSPPQPFLHRPFDLQCHTMSNAPELSRLAGQVPISALAVPVNKKTEEAVEEGQDRAFDITTWPTRIALLKDPTRWRLSDRLLSTALVHCA